MKSNYKWIIDWILDMTYFCKAYVEIGRLNEEDCVNALNELSEIASGIKE